MAIISAEDLKKEIKDYNYKVLTSGDDSIAERCIEKAEIWARAKVIATKATFEDNDINRQIVKKQALYELYSYAENEEVARDKKEDAIELLRAAYGNAIDAAGFNSQAAQSALPAGAIKPGKLKDPKW